MKRTMSIGSPEWIGLIVEGAARLGTELSADQAAAFAAHAHDLLRWNRRVNLTAITEPFEMAVKHYLDSIVAVPLIQAFMHTNAGASLLDVGSGAGFPGIPLKIAIPALRVSLLEARRKRANYLKQAVRCLKLSGVRVWHQRLEDRAGEMPVEERFDLIVCRAFSELTTFVRSALPWLKHNGMVLAYKGGIGGKTAGEIEALRSLEMAGPGQAEDQRGKQPQVHVTSCRLPYLEVERTLIVISATGSQTEKEVDR